MTTNTRRSRIAAAILGTSMAMFGISQALAGDSGTPITVSYADLDLSSPQSAAVLYRRIELAAESVCAPLDHGDVLSRQHRQSCVTDTVTRAVSSVNSPGLRAVYEAHNGGVPASPPTASR